MKFNFYNQGDLRFELTDDILVGNTGLGFIGKVLSQVNFDLMVNEDVMPHGNQTIRTSDSLRTMIGIIAQGELSYQEVEELRDDSGFSYINSGQKSAFRVRIATTFG